ncbi:MAG: serine/threonine protein kinase [Polyangiaceae bacterium]
MSASVGPPRATPLAPGFKLDRYELLCPVAEGGMASVWIARQTGKHGFEKLVAIKTILPKYAADARFQQMFLDEARIASRIEHPNVAQILDVGEQHETTYLVMEYVDGDSLSSLQRALQKKEMSFPHGAVLRMMAEVCGGLHAAHELRNDDGGLLGVVHRDVSPQNVLVSSKGIAKLIDFGIAKARDRLAGDTNADTLKGKVRYMAPEQAQGHTVDRRADVWAVGAILYHCLAGKPPFDGENDMQTLLMLTSGKPPPPLPQSVHPSVAAVVARALTTPPDRRYATAAEMQVALQDAALEAGATSSAQAIASFLSDHLADAGKKRKEAIALGIKAASDRERYAEMMRSNVRTANPISSTGVSEPGSSRTGSLRSSASDVAAGGVKAPSNKISAPVLAAIVLVVLGLAGAVLAVRSTSSSPYVPGAVPSVQSSVAASHRPTDDSPRPGDSAGTVSVQSLPGVVVAATDLPQVPPAPSASVAPAGQPQRPGGRPPPGGKRNRHVDDGF